ncbi:HD domain-containing protein [Paracoccus litorisediminis]|uniref:HD domain-containing protein n=1 Tax=Paracoccus litorisediminis TaxID=2006130 RepID=UPI00372E5692
MAEAEKDILDRVKTETIALRYYLQGRGFTMALEAMEFAKSYHQGTRKDGITPEFFHQVSMANFARTLVSGLRHPEEVFATIFLHDAVEDGGLAVAEIRRRFSDRVADAVDALSKVIGGVKRSPADVRRMIEADPVASVVKGIDRANNQGSMLGVFSLEKQVEYIEETEGFILPILKQGRRSFPDQEPVYENIKHLLTREIRLLRALHAEIRAREAEIEGLHEHAAGPDI